MDQCKKISIANCFWAGVAQFNLFLATEKQGKNQGNDVGIQVRNIRLTWIRGEQASPRAQAEQGTNREILKDPAGG